MYFKGLSIFRPYQTLSFSSLYFPACGLNTKRYRKAPKFAIQTSLLKKIAGW